MALSQLLHSMRELSEKTHSTQIHMMTLFFFLNISGLFYINKLKVSPKNTIGQKVKWTTKRNAYWGVVFTLLCTAVLLDVYFPIETTFFHPIKAYIFAFPLGLLDLYYSKTNGIKFSKVIPGAGFWCLTLIMRHTFIRKHFGEDEHNVILVQNLSLLTIPMEICRYAFFLLGSGLMTDVFFSPLHRLTHHSSIYKSMHKTHHEFTNNLTSLVLYHANYFDDFLMAFTTVIGGILYFQVLQVFGMHSQMTSNFVEYMVVFNTLLSHAHDIRCAKLLAPVPDEMNFVAYHYVHHLFPSNNFGLTEPSDKLWDWILGVETIMKVDTAMKKYDGRSE
ncbi:predicted protein [Chaetoceros tenuissimus]|uniref:Fatty acid hydroxylase domain-containing protein n=1 Tax=Chaetoceros tenuissimus TaxID=426638 RepID=A0AAD3D758_9STRA|nr:predicted protein [Chaetoceros tenuissimus]